MQDALRAYLELALGITEASRKRATKVVEGLVGKGGEFVGKSGATAKQVQAMAGDLIATSAANREALVKLVRFEVDRALGAVGLATAEEVGELTSRLRGLERQLDEARSRLASASAAKRASARAIAASGTGRTTTRQSATGPSAVKKSAAKKTAAKKSAAKKTAASEPTAKKTGTRMTSNVAEKAPARKSARKGATGGAKRTPARKSTSRAARS